jgi:hypothetical protein
MTITIVARLKHSQKEHKLSTAHKKFKEWMQSCEVRINATKPIVEVLLLLFLAIKKKNTAIALRGADNKRWDARVSYKKGEFFYRDQKVDIYGEYEVDASSDSSVAAGDDALQQERARLAKKIEEHEMRRRQTMTTEQRSASEEPPRAEQVDPSVNRERVVCADSRLLSGGPCAINMQVLQFLQQQSDSRTPVWLGRSSTTMRCKSKIVHMGNVDEAKAVRYLKCRRIDQFSTERLTRDQERVFGYTNQDVATNTPPAAPFVVASCVLTTRLKKSLKSTEGVLVVTVPVWNGIRYDEVWRLIFQVVNTFDPMKRRLLINRQDIQPEMWKSFNAMRQIFQKIVIVDIMDESFGPSSTLFSDKEMEGFIVINPLADRQFITATRWGVESELPMLVWPAINQSLSATVVTDVPTANLPP